MVSGVAIESATEHGGQFGGVESHQVEGIGVKLIERFEQLDLSRYVSAFDNCSQGGFACVWFEERESLDERKIDGAIVVALDEGETCWQRVRVHGLSTGISA